MHACYMQLSVLTHHTKPIHRFIYRDVCMHIHTHMYMKEGVGEGEGGRAHRDMQVLNAQQTTKQSEWTTA